MVLFMMSLMEVLVW